MEDDQYNDIIIEDYVIRLYNVPIDYTIAKLKELLIETCPKLEIKQIIPPSPWEDKIDVSWKVICKNQNSYNLLLAQEDIWIKRDKKSQQTRVITSIAGNHYDIPHIPFKDDEQILLNEHISNQSPKNK